MSGYHKRNPETFPVNRLKRVDRPTTIIEDGKVQRVKQSDSGFNKASRGDYGPSLQKGRDSSHSLAPYPLEGAQLRMTGMMRSMVDGIVATQKAPISENPQKLSQHIKETAYFLRADAVGICNLLTCPPQTRPVIIS